MSGSLSEIVKEQDIINVMIVDDAPIVRKFYMHMLEQNPHVHIVAIAENGLDALIKQRNHDIDVIILDIEMPVMNGLEALTKLLYYDPEIMVIIASTLNWEHAEITHIALNSGAADYLEKPSAVRRNLSAQEFQDYMNEKVLTLGLQRREILARDMRYSSALEKKRGQLSQRHESQDDADSLDNAQEHKKPVKHISRTSLPIQKPSQEKNDSEKDKLETKKNVVSPKTNSPIKSVVKSVIKEVTKDVKIAKKPSSLKPRDTEIQHQKTIKNNPATKPKELKPLSAPNIGSLKDVNPEEVKRNHKIFADIQQANQDNQNIQALRPVPANFRPKAIALGASTGGPPLVQKLVPELAQLGLPIFLTQHMPNFFTGVLAEQLASRNNLNVKEVYEKEMAVENNGIYVAHGGSHLGIKKSGNQISVYEDKESPPEHCCKPSVEVMVKHMMAVYGKDILMIVLTGMGRDGHISAETLVDKGGVVIVQDKETSLIWGMPGAIAHKGATMATLPPQEILPWCKKLLKS